MVVAQRSLPVSKRIGRAVTPRAVATLKPARGRHSRFANSACWASTAGVRLLFLGAKLAGSQRPANLLLVLQMSSSVHTLFRTGAGSSRSFAREQTNGPWSGQSTGRILMGKFERTPRQRCARTAGEERASGKMGARAQARFPPTRSGQARGLAAAHHSGGSLAHLRASELLRAH